MSCFHFLQIRLWVYFPVPTPQTCHTGKGLDIHAWDLWTSVKHRTESLNISYILFSSAVDNTNGGSRDEGTHPSYLTLLTPVQTFKLRTFKSPYNKLLWLVWPIHHFSKQRRCQWQQWPPLLWHSFEELHYTRTLDIQMPSSTAGTSVVDIPPLYRTLLTEFYYHITRGYTFCVYFIKLSCSFCWSMMLTDVLLVVAWETEPPVKTPI